TTMSRCKLLLTKKRRPIPSRGGKGPLGEEKILHIGILKRLNCSNTNMRLREIRCGVADSDAIATTGGGAGYALSESEGVDRCLSPWLCDPIVRCGRRAAPRTCCQSDCSSLWVQLRPWARLTTFGWAQAAAGSAAGAGGLEAASVRAIQGN